jgi:hypothetical protein
MSVTCGAGSPLEVTGLNLLWSDCVQISTTLPETETEFHKLPPDLRDVMKAYCHYALKHLLEELFMLSVPIGTSSDEESSVTCVCSVIAVLVTAS